MRAPELTTALWEHCIRTRVYVTPYPADVHDVAGVDTNVPGGCVIVLEPPSVGPIPATIDRTKKPIRNCCFGLCGTKTPAIRPRISLIKLKNSSHSFEARPLLQRSLKKFLCQSRNFVRYQLIIAPYITSEKSKKGANHGYLYDCSYEWI